MSGLDTLLASQSAEATKGTEGKKGSSSTATTPKEGASLFDSMLAQLNTKGSSEVSLDGSEGETKTGLSKEGTAQQGEAKSQANGTAQKGGVSTTAGATTQSNSNGTPSLFDKMVAQTNQQNTPIDINAETTAKVDGTQPNIAATKQSGVQTLSTPSTQNPTTQAATKQSSISNSQNPGTKVDINVSRVSSDMKSDNISKAQNTSTYTTAPQEIDDAALDALESKNALGNKSKDGLAQTQSSTPTQTVKTSKSDNPQSGSISKNIDTPTVQNEQSVKPTDIALNNKGDNNNIANTTKQNLSAQNTTSDNSINTNTKQAQQTLNTTANTDAQTVATQTTPKKDGVVDNTKQSTKTVSTVGTANLETTKKPQTVEGQNGTTQSLNPKAQTTDQVKVENSVQTTQQNTQNLNPKVSSAIQTDSVKNVSVDTASQNVNKTDPSQTIVQNSDTTKPNTSNAVEGTNDQDKKLSLADKLISTAAATALADKATSDKATLNDTRDIGTKQTTQQNTPTADISPKQTAQIKTSSPNGLAQTQTISANGVESIASDSTSTIDNDVEKADIKNIEQNITDKKIDNKTLDTKQALDKHQLIQGEKDHIEKVSLAGGVAATTLSSKDTSGSAGTTVSNQELASQLATIRDTAKEGVATVSSNEVKNALKHDNKESTQDTKKQQSGNTLLDKMMQETQSSTDTADSVDDGTLGTKDHFVQKDLPLFATSAYLNDQKKRNEIANMMKKSEGVKEALNAKGVSDIKKSADTLGLNAGETQVIEEAVQKEESRAHNNREDMLKRLAFDNNVGKKLHNNTQQLRTNETIVAQAASLTDNIEEKVVEVAVSNEAAQTIENRIIGARQTLRSMMSDIARQMAQNYRPPLTAFRINLNPAGLGNIAVMLKGEQSKGISISLNVSNSNTLDTMVDNQAALRAALTRNFDTATNFELNFGMQQDNNSNQNQNNEQANQNSGTSSEAVQVNNTTNQEVEEVTEQVNYM